MAWFNPPWWWQNFGKRLSRMEHNIMSLQQDASDIKSVLDGIAADVGPIKAGIDAMAANLAAALATEKPDPDMLKAALDEAKGLKATFDQMAASFAAAGSPIPESPAPAPAEPAPAASSDPAPASSDPAPASTDGTETKPAE